MKKIIPYNELNDPSKVWVVDEKACEAEKRQIIREIVKEELKIAIEDMK